MRQMYDARWVLTICLFIAFFLALGYIKFLDWCAVYIAWATVIIMELSLVGIGLISFFCRKELVDNNSVDDSAITAYTWAIWTSWILAALYFVILICKFKALRIAIAVIETAADFFSDTKRVIFIPLGYFAVHMITFFIWFFGLICLLSYGPIQADNVML